MSDIGKATQDFQDNVDRADVWVNGTDVDSYTAKDGSNVPSIRNLSKKAEINIDKSEEYAEKAKGYAENAEEASIKAQEAVVASQINAGVYSSVEEGIAKTKDKDLFLVVTDHGIDIYENNQGSADLLVKDVTSISSIDNIKKTALFKGNSLSELTEDYQDLDQARENIGLDYMASSQSGVSKAYNNDYNGSDLLKIIDSGGLETWIQIDENGLPTDSSKNAIERKFGVSHEDMPDQHDLMFSITTKEGVVTHLSLNNNGELPDFVIKNISERIGVKGYTNDIGFVGSSSIWLMHNLIKKYFADYKLALLGDSGARFDSIAVRAGFPAKLKFPVEQITKGSNDVEASWEVDRGMDRFSVTLDNGIKGDLLFSVDKYVFHSNEESLILIDSEIDFKSDFGLFDFVFINSGKNNLGAVEGIGKIIYEKTLDLVKFYESKGIDYVVMDHFVNQNSNPKSKVEVLECNRLLKLRFGKKFLSIFEMIKSDEMWSFTGIEKTEDDLLALENDELPPSFQMNTSHLNETANNYIVMKMLEKYEEQVNEDN